MSFYTTSKEENPLVAEVNKQDLRFVANPVSLLSRQSMAIASFRHAQSCSSVIWSPNWQQVDGHNNFPTGFQFTVNPNAPVYDGMFSAKQMYGVQMAFPLDAGVNSAYHGKDKVDSNFFSKNHDQMSAVLLDKIKESDLSATGASNFSGIFSTGARTENGFEKKLYVVARYADLNTSDKIRQKIKAAKPQDDEKSIQYIDKLAERGFNADPSYVGMACPHTTWNELFLADAEMTQLRDEQVRQCANLMLRTMHSCGLGSVVGGTRSTTSENISALLKSDDVVKTIFNDVDHIAPGGDLAYLSEMASIHSSANGLVFRNTPKLGITIFKRLAIQQKEGSNLIGLPCTTGQMCSISTHNKSLTADSLPELEVKRPFIWDSSTTKNKYNTLMSQSLYRNTSSKEWRDIASSIGMNESSSTNDVIHLEPIIVRMVATPQPQLKK